MGTLRAPFPYFGGKSPVAHEVWSRLGPVKCYVEPFFGSGAILLARPGEPGIEIVNDKDAYLANFWRAVQADPDRVAELMDWPVNEADLEARHKWLVTAARKADHARRMKDEPDYYDAEIAARWCWGLCAWIGTGWCSGEWHGPGSEANRGGGIAVRDTERGGKIPQLGGHGNGVHGVSRQMPKVGGTGNGVLAKREPDFVLEWVRRLSARLRRVKVCCGDWKRITGPSATFLNGLTGVVLDPPYGVQDRSPCYKEEDFSVSAEVRAWAIEAGENPLMRICVCGYEGEHEFPEGWTTFRWKAQGGLANQSKKRRADGEENRDRERIWFSPHCLGSRQPEFF